MKKDMQDCTSLRAVWKRVADDVSCEDAGM